MSDDSLTARLLAAEAVCTMYGWSPSHTDTPREKALRELWSRWVDLVGSDAITPERNRRLARQEHALEVAYGSRKQQAELERHVNAGGSPP